MSDQLHHEIRKILKRYTYAPFEYDETTLYGVFTLEEVSEANFPLSFVAIASTEGDAEEKIEELRIRDIIAAVQAQTPPAAPPPLRDYGPAIPHVPPHWPNRLPETPYPTAPDIIFGPSTTCGPVHGDAITGFTHSNAGDDDFITSGPFEGMTGAEATDLVRQGT